MGISCSEYQSSRRCFCTKSPPSPPSPSPSTLTTTTSISPTSPSSRSLPTAPAPPTPTVVPATRASVWTTPVALTSQLAARVNNSTATFEKRHFGTLFYVEKGCKQDLACHNEFNLNDRSVSGVDIKGSPLKQCYGTDTSADVSICRQCCSNIANNNCNSAYDANHAATYSNWQATGNHDFSHLYS